MRESRTPGSARGVLSNGHSYRNIPCNEMRSGGKVCGTPSVEVASKSRCLFAPRSLRITVQQTACKF